MSSKYFEALVDHRLPRKLSVSSTSPRAAMGVSGQMGLGSLIGERMTFGLCLTTNWRAVVRVADRQISFRSDRSRATR